MCLLSLFPSIYLYIERRAVYSVGATSLCYVIGIACVYCCGLQSWPVFDVIDIHCDILIRSHGFYCFALFPSVIVTGMPRSWFSINRSAWVSACYWSQYKNSLEVSRTLSPAFESVPAIFLGENRNMRPPPPSPPISGYVLTRPSS